MLSLLAGLTSLSVQLFGLGLRLCPRLFTWSKGPGQCLPFHGLLAAPCDAPHSALLHPFNTPWIIFVFPLGL